MYGLEPNPVPTTSFLILLPFWGPKKDVGTGLDSIIGLFYHSCSSVIPTSPTFDFYTFAPGATPSTIVQRRDSARPRTNFLSNISTYVNPADSLLLGAHAQRGHVCVCLLLYISLLECLLVSQTQRRSEIRTVFSENAPLQSCTNSRHFITAENAHAHYIRLRAILFLVVLQFRELQYYRASKSHTNWQAKDNP